MLMPKCKEIMIDVAEHARRINDLLLVVKPNSVQAWNICRTDNYCAIVDVSLSGKKEKAIKGVCVYVC